MLIRVKIESPLLTPDFNIDLINAMLFLLALFLLLETSVIC